MQSERARALAQATPAWDVFTPAGTSGTFNGITYGPERAVWVADYGSGSIPGGIVKIDVTGKFHEYFVPPYNPEELAAGADGNLYFDPGRDVSKIGRLTPAGNLRIFAIPSGDCICGNGMTLGRDGNVWFAEIDHIGYIAPDGHIVEYSGIYPGFGVGLAYGPDGRLWVATENPFLYALTPSTGKVQQYSLPSGCYTRSVVSGAGKLLWFSCQGTPQRIGKITTSGSATTYDIAPWAVSEPAHDMLIAHDGSPWFVGQATIHGQLANSINHVDPATGKFRSYRVPNTPFLNFSWDIVQDGRQNIWDSTHSGEIDVLLSAADP